MSDFIPNWQEQTMEQKLGEFNSLHQEAANELTSSDRLKQLPTDSYELARQVANNPSVPPELLRELAKSSDRTTRFHVAANPNTPTDVLWQLGTEFPLQLLDNPIFSLLLLENPNLVETIPWNTLLSLLKEDSVPVSFVEWAANQSHEEILLAVVMNAQTPKSALEKLIHSYYSQVAEAAQLHINYAGEITPGSDEVAREAIGTTALYQDYKKYLEQLAKHGSIPDFLIDSLPKNSELLQELANNPNNPENTLEFLSRNKDWEIRLGVAANSKTPGRILQELAKDNNSWIRDEVARNPNTPTSVFQQLAKSTAQSSNDGHYWEELVETGLINQLEEASNFSKAEINFEELAKNSNWQSRLEIAQNPNTPERILEYLAKEREFLICLEIAANPNTPGIILNKLVRYDSRQFFHNFHSTSNSIVNFLGELMAPQAKFWISLEVAGNPNTPVKILEQLAQDYPEHLMWRKLAENPNTPVFILEELANKDSETQRKLAANPNTRGFILEKLAKNKDSWVRSAVAQNPNTPMIILKELLSDRSEKILTLAVIRYLAHNPDKLSVVLQHYPKDYPSSFLSRLVILLHPELPNSLLVENSRSLKWIERYAIAQHSNTPTDTLQTLTKDANRIVRAAAKANLECHHTQP